MKDILDKHYKNFAGKYEKYLYYSQDFVRSLSSKMIEKLDLGEHDRFVDLGGGTGMYSIDIHRQISFKNPTFCVDAYPEMLAQIPKDQYPIQPVCMDALAFSSDGFFFNKVLIKEAVHHIQDRKSLFAKLHNKLPASGRLLLVHVPPDIQYPIFQKALDRAKTWHACPEEMMEELKSLGFDVALDGLDFSHKILKEKYFDQVRNRFMSVLHTFNDEELEAGLKEMEQEYHDAELLEFIDHFDFITAIKT